MSRLLIYTGVFMIAAGLLVARAPWIFSWFGRLPWDIRIAGKRGVFYFLIVSPLLTSVVASIILSLFRRQTDQKLSRQEEQDSQQDVCVGVMIVLSYSFKRSLR